MSVCLFVTSRSPAYNSRLFERFTILCKNGWTDRRQSLKPTPIHAKCKGVRQTKLADDRFIRVCDTKRYTSAVCVNMESLLNKWPMNVSVDSSLILRIIAKPLMPVERGEKSYQVLRESELERLGRG